MKPRRRCGDVPVPKLAGSKIGAAEFGDRTASATLFGDPSLPSNFFTGGDRVGSVGRCGAVD